MANNSEKTIDQLFKQKLENFELSSQDSSWKMLQLVKERNLRKKRFLLAKTVFEIIVLFSAALLFLFSKETTMEKPLYSQDFAAERLQYTNDLNTEDNNANKINKAAIQTNTKKTTINDFNSYLLTSANKETLLQQLEENYFGSIPQFDITKKENKLLLASESSTVYKDWNKTQRVTVQRINEGGINSPFDEYAPVINQNGSFMFFTSRRPITQNEIRKGKGKERIYYTETSPTGWTKAQLLEAPLNSEKSFNSAVSLSNDGQHLFIYRDDRFGNGDIYESQYSGSQWSKPVALPSPINSEFHESTVSLSPDGNTLYFTSNRVGGVGGMDIWCTHKNKAGIWGEAENLGEAINTDNDEDGVFIHPDGKTLYFSSRGHNGLGGYDIYYSTLENGEWAEPINLGSNINTKNDDVYFVLTADGKNAYYASVNPKTPDKKDIFKIKYNHDFHKEITNKNYSLVKGNVLSKNDRTPINATIEIYEKASKKLITTLKSDAETGAFSFPAPLGENYLIHIYKEGYLYYDEEILSQSSKNHQEINQQILLDPLQNNSQFILTNLLANKNEDVLEQSVQSALDYLYQFITINPELTVQLSLEINSNKESDFDNHQKIVDKCIQYLKLKGINENRINGKVVLDGQINEPTTKTTPLLVNIISI